MVQVEDDLPAFISINFQGIKHINAMDLNWFLIELDGKKIDMNELQIIIRGGYRAQDVSLCLSYISYASASISQTFLFAQTLTIPIPSFNYEYF